MTATPPDAPPQLSLYSVAIFVRDIDRAVEFYRDGLALPLTRRGSFGAEFLQGPTRLGVHPAVHPDAQSMVGRHTGITLFVPGLLHYCGRLHERAGDRPQGRDPRTGRDHPRLGQRAYAP